MGCEQSTPVDTNDAKEETVKTPTAEITGVGRTERQLSKMQREAMNGQLHTGTIPGKNKKDEVAPAPPQLDEQGFLMPEEVAKRTFSSISNREAMLGTPQNVTLVQFAHWTQRGYYPDDPHKQNQDEFGTHLQFAGVERDAMFAVYDGHGKQGHACSRFAKERLPKAIAKHIRKVRCQNYQNNRPAAEGKKGGWDPSRWPMLKPKEYEYCCRKAFLEVNQAMHEDSSVPDSMSGTTATAVNFHGNYACISNVGDSRVVVGHRVRSNPDDTISVYSRGGSNLVSAHSGTGEEEKNDVDDEISYSSGREAMGHPVGAFDKIRPSPPGTRVMAIPLSKDHTPYRKDERDRIKAAGGTVMTIDQIKGKEEKHENWGDLVLGDTIDVEGDSPRVWVNGNFQGSGCAFTRSLGDSTSEAIGVTAEPEILTTELTMNDEYMVVASDGIFEFLTNQDVIDLCVTSESPLVACEKIVKASYQQWLTYEKRTDDITIVVCFLQNFKQPRLGGKERTTEDLLETMATFYGERPEHMSTPAVSGRYTFKRSSSPRNDEIDTSRSYSCGRSIASVEDEAVAYHAEEAHAVIVRSTTPPESPMVFDDYEESCGAEDTIENLMKEVNASGSVTNRTVSDSSSHEDDNNTVDDGSVVRDKDQNGNITHDTIETIMEEDIAPNSVENTATGESDKTMDNVSGEKDKHQNDDTTPETVQVVPAPVERNAIRI